MQLKKIPLAILFGALSVFSQNKIKPLDKAQVNILYNYYQQDGNNGAVTGGLGTEGLDSSEPQISVSLPLNKVSTFGITLGLDHYTSASTANIDKYGSTTSASTATTSGEGNLSSEDTRRYASLNFSRLIPEKNTTIALTYGFSKEFDVKSNYAKIMWQKEDEQGNKFLSINAGIFIDKWMLIYPGEIRAGRSTGLDRNKVKHREDDDDDEHEDEYDDDDDDDERGYRDYYPQAGRRFNLTFERDDDHDDYDDDEDDDDKYEDHEYKFGESDRHSSKKKYNNTGYPTDTRFTYDISVTYGGNINERLNASITASVIFQRGILNTPFHRVYFKDGIEKEEFKLVKTEKLPRSRTKKALGIRANYFVNNFLITRCFYRFYNDDFGITAHTLELEFPLKLGDEFTLYPFYRFHTQTQSKYFKPYGQHELNAEYYTSDYDLSSFNANKYGLGIKCSPNGGVFSFKINEKRKFQLKSVEFRVSNYKRSTGLEATSITLGNVFTF